MFNGEIISIGTELLLGQINNTNTQYISTRMAEIGCSIFYHVTVGDNQKRLELVIKQASLRSNLVVFTGGLGPTHDDITKEVFSRFINKSLILDDFSYKKIVQYFTEKNIIMSENNKKQAMVIEGSTVFFNENGFAPGMGIISNNIYYIFLPGPPNEMMVMLDKYVIPWLKELNNNVVFLSETMRFTGTGESMIDARIADLFEIQDNPTIALLATDGEVLVRLTARGENKQEALNYIKPIENEIHKRLAEYHYGNGINKIEYVVLQLLKKNMLTFSTAESCTGGLIGDFITNYSGSSLVYTGGIISYSNKIKNEFLNISEELLEEHGAVSNQVAKAMAENISESFNTDIGISTTGIVGPDSIEGKPIGLIYIGISVKNNETRVYKLNLSGTRTTIKIKAAKYAFYYLWHILKKDINK